MTRTSSRKTDYISVNTSLGMSRGIPGYPGGLPRGSAGEAGPVPPRPLPFSTSRLPHPEQTSRSRHSRTGNSAPYRPGLLSRIRARPDADMPGTIR